MDTRSTPTSAVSEAAPPGLVLTGEADPRLQPDFEPVHYPRCDGTLAPPPGTTDPIEQRQLQFLAVYYRLNQWQARLRAVRAGEAPGPPERLMREIHQAIQDRDALEDRYESEGFFGEPVMQGLLYVNLEFMHAHKRHFYRGLTSSQFSFSVAIPPTGIDVAPLVHAQLSLAFGALMDHGEEEDEGEHEDEHEEDEPSDGTTQLLPIEEAGAPRVKRAACRTRSSATTSKRPRP